MFILLYNSIPTTPLLQHSTSCVSFWTLDHQLLFIFILGAPCNTQSRTSEVWRCENIMEVARNNVELSMLPLLNHSFEEVTKYNY